MWSNTVSSKKRLIAHAICRGFYLNFLVKYKSIVLLLIGLLLFVVFCVFGYVYYYVSRSLSDEDLRLIENVSKNVLFFNMKSNWWW